jgi:hypothetical protein
MLVIRGRSRYPILMVFVVTTLFYSNAFAFQISLSRKDAPSKTSARSPYRDAPEGQADWFLMGRRFPPAPSRMRTLSPQTPAAQSSAASKLREAFAEGSRVMRLGPEIAQPNWIELGPRPELFSNWGMVSGRVTSLAIDPSDKSGNSIYVGTAFGGIWKCEQTETNSPKCAPLSDFQVSLSIGSIAVSSKNGVTTIYVGQGAWPVAAKDGRKARSRSRNADGMGGRTA